MTSAKSPTNGERLLNLRHQTGLTIPELSAKSGVATGTISNVENDRGDAQISTLQKLVQALGFTINDLNL